MHRFLGTVEEIATLDTVKLMVVVGWITAIPFEEWGQQKPHGVLPLKPAMMSNRTWFNMGEATDPLVHDVLSGHYPGCIAQQAMLGVVMPGDHIPPHVDHQCPEWVERIHIPLTTNKACSFVCGGVEHHMEVGKAYRVNTEAVHAVYNRGWVPRVHFMFDVRTKMLRPQGYSLLVDPETGTVEQDTYTCAHCQKVTFVKALVRPDELGGFCRKCMALVCKDCAGKECKPIMKQIEEWERVGNMILAGGK